MNAMSHTIGRADESHKIETYGWNESLIVVPSICVTVKGELH